MYDFSRIGSAPERGIARSEVNVSDFVRKDTSGAGAGCDARNGACAARPAERPRDASGAKRPLGNTQIILHPTNESRAKRYRLRNELRTFSTLTRLCKCGSTPVSGGGVGVRLTTIASKKIAGFSGVSTCGSVWACPVCSAKIGAQRSEEVSDVLKYAHAQGKQAVMMTFTVRHNAGDSLKSVWSAVSKGWARVTGGKAWKADVEKFGIVGWLRAVEVTYGKNGWHVHTHVIAIYDAPKNAELELGARLWNRWEAGISKAGFTAIAGQGGFDITKLEKGSDLGGYFSKQCDAFSKEITLGAFKQARAKENFTPFQLLRFFIETGDMDALATWHEWEKGSKGRRQMLWSKGLREWAKLGQERTDEEVAEEEIGTVEDTLLVLPGESWKTVKHFAWLLLDIAESGGKDALISWLEQEKIPWYEPPKNCADTIE